MYIVSEMVLFRTIIHIGMCIMSFVIYLSDKYMFVGR
jgi:hypothetical protein